MSAIVCLPPPDDPAPRGFAVKIPVAGDSDVEAVVDLYSDRLRCDHPDVDDGRALGRALTDEAVRESCGRVVVLVHEELAAGLRAVGTEQEAAMPGFYSGEGDCAVMGLALDDSRSGPADADALQKVERLLRDAPPERSRSAIDTERAFVGDGEAIAQLITDTFDHYPTPSGVSAYIDQHIEEGTPFRLVREGDEVVACASADLVPEARTAELTDCATRPTHRGRGLMQAILADLVVDLKELGYPTAFTLARAQVPGVNLAFQRLGFELRGRMAQSCRIGTGLEDMNVWSRRLAEEVI